MPSPVSNGQKLTWSSGWTWKIINICMKNALRILGSLLIALGISVLVAGCIVGIAVWIVGLFQSGDYTVAVGTSGVILVSLGYVLRWVLRSNDQ